MKRVRGLVRRLGGCERGWTLIELLVAATIGMVVLGGAVTVFMGAVKSEPRASARASAIQEGRVALERMTRELRQGVEVDPTSTASELVLLTYVNESPCGGAASANAIPCQVTYSCAADACTRTVAAPDGTAPGPPSVVVSDLTDAEVFEWTGSEPDRVEVELSFEKSQSTDTTVLSDGATLRSGGAS